MIERGHEHRMEPTGVFEPGDGTTVIEYRCVSQPATVQNPTPCRMQERRVYRGDQLVELKIRLHNAWFHPFDLLRSMPLTARECSACGGEDHLGVCANCHGLGIEAAFPGALDRPKTYQPVA